VKSILTWSAILFGACVAAQADDNQAPDGFELLFNGKDFSGWNGRSPGLDPVKLKAMSDEERQAAIEKDTADMKEHWSVDDGQLVNDGHGAYLTTDKDYRDFELYVSWKLIPHGDSGVYLKATPQVQIWDYTDPDYIARLKADTGSGGLWNNAPDSPGKDPLVRADKPIGEWNTFRIIQVGARTTVSLNGTLVVDHAPLQNYWKSAFRADLPKPFEFNTATPLISDGPVQLQTHGNEVRWKNIYIREIPVEEANQILASHGDEGFKSFFDGESLAGWGGATDNYEVVDGAIRCKAGTGGVLHTTDEFGDFIARVEFKLPPAGNNGLAIRYPGEGNAAYDGMCELQVIDNTSEKYAQLDPRQYHGSVYGMIPAFRGYQRPVGEWNFQEVTVKGSTVKVELNGFVIVEGDVSQVKEADFMDNHPHPGKDRTSGSFGFAGHGDPVEFRKIQIKAIE
jgi:hypothetical protein